LIEFGGAFKIDKDSSLKGKVDSSGKVGVGYSQKVKHFFSFSSKNQNPYKIYI